MEIWIQTGVSLLYDVDMAGNIERRCMMQTADAGWVGIGIREDFLMGGTFWFVSHMYCVRCRSRREVEAINFGGSDITGCCCLEPQLCLTKVGSY